jgi:RNA polymerase sigma factor (sigma-70 family)
MTPDQELLSRYAEERDEAAFAEVVRRHLNLVHAAAARLTHGNAPLAEDVTQAVFADLARKAGELRGHASLTGWLHTSTRYAAAAAVRAEVRRQTHEQEASAMNEIYQEDRTVGWTQLRPVLDEAVGGLAEEDRDAVLLRFFQDKSHREIGEALGVSENAARMRVERAVERLRGQFVRRGITASAALLSSALGAQVVSPAAPAGLGATVTSHSLAGMANLKSAAGQVGTRGMAAKTKAALLGAGAVLAAGAVIWITRGPQEAQPLAPKAAVTASTAIISNSTTTPMNTQQLLSVAALVAASATVTTASAATAASGPDAAMVVAQNASDGVSASADTAGNVAATATVGAASATPAQNAAANTATPAVITGIVTWGQNGHGELGAGITGGPMVVGRRNPVSNVPVLVDTSGVLKGKTVVAIACGGSYLAPALGPDGKEIEIETRGNSGITMIPNYSPEDGGGPGALHRLALCSDGTLVAWGCDETGELGDGKSGPGVFSSEPVLVNTRGALKGQRITKIAAGEGYSLAISAEGKLYAWGHFPWPMTINGRFSSATPVLINAPGLEDKKVAMVSPEGGLVLYTDGTLLGLGNWYHYVKGVGNDIQLFPPVVRPYAREQSNLPPLDLHLAGFDGNSTQGSKPPQAPKPSVARLRLMNTDGLLEGKTVVTLLGGEGAVQTDDGKLALLAGGATSPGVLRPDQVAMVVRFLNDAATPGAPGVQTQRTITAVAGSGGAGLGLYSDGTLVTWGLGDDGQWGNGQTKPSTQGGHILADRPVAVRSGGVLKGKVVTAISSMSDEGFLALCSDGTLVAWGTGYLGGLGDGRSGTMTSTGVDYYHSAVPVKVDQTGVLKGKTIVAIAPGMALFTEPANAAGQN